MHYSTSNLTFRLTLSTMFLEDHLERLYNRLEAGRYGHIDHPEWQITVIRSGKTSSVIDATLDAVTEMIDDADYQADPGDGGGNRVALGALRSIQRQMKTCTVQS